MNKDIIICGTKRKLYVRKWKPMKPVGFGMEYGYFPKRGFKLKIQLVKDEVVVKVRLKDLGWKCHKTAKNRLRKLTYTLGCLANAVIQPFSVCWMIMLLNCN